MQEAIHRSERPMAQEISTRWMGGGEEQNPYTYSTKLRRNKRVMSIVMRADAS